jgi:hypothetical protein
LAVIKSDLRVIGLPYQKLSRLSNCNRGNFCGLKYLVVTGEKSFEQEIKLNKLNKISIFFILDLLPVLFLRLANLYILQNLPEKTCHCFMIFFNTDIAIKKWTQS